jgi:hypothetical protein
MLLPRLGKHAESNLMAETATIERVVKTLCEAHGRRPTPETFDAYDLALREFSDDTLDRALVSALRERREYMPPPGLIAGMARELRESNRRAEREADDRRIVCRDCDDCGYVMTINRRWLATHIQQLSPEWFVGGWLRDAEVWCRTNDHSSLFRMAVCNCDCYSAKNNREQRDRFRKLTDEGVRDERKNPKPSFGVLREADDCLVATKSSVDAQTAILNWLHL